MNAKEYLSQARSIKIRIGAMEEQLDFLKSSALCAGSQFSNMPKSATRNIHKNEDAIIRVLEKEEQIKAARLRLDEIIAIVDEVSDSTHHAILVKRYLSNKTWVEITKELYISDSHVRRLHQSALAEVEVLLKNGRK